MAGPLFPHINSDVTRQEMADIAQQSDDTIQSRLAAPEGSEHSTHRSGHIRYYDRPDADMPTDDYETRFLGD